MKETCPGDIAGGEGGIPDQTVDAADLAVVLGAWGAPGGVADVTDATQSDACGDNVVDASDLGFALGAWGSCTSRPMVGGGTTPTELAEQMGFATVQELADWLAELGPESAQAWLDLMLG